MAADLASRIAYLHALLPAFWIDFAGDRKVSPILAGQWFLAFTDTWTLDANAMAVPSPHSAGAARSPACRGAHPPPPSGRGRRRPPGGRRRCPPDPSAPIRAAGVRPVISADAGVAAGRAAGSVAALVVALALAVVVLSLGLAAAPRSVSPTTATARGSTAGRARPPPHPRGPCSNWQGGVVLDFTNGHTPACPDPIRVRRAAGVLRLATAWLRPDLVAHPPPAVP